MPCSNGWPSEPHTRLRYYCSPYHVNSALHPIIEQLERAAGFEPDDLPERKLDKLEALLSRATDERGRGGAAVRGLALHPGRSALCAAQHAGAAPAGAHDRGPAGSAWRPCRSPAGAHGAGGQPLDRPDLDRALRARHRAGADLAGAAADHLPPGVRAALDQLPAHDVADPEPSGPPAQHRDDRRGCRRQAAARGDPGRRSGPRPTACRCSSRS